MTTLNLSIVIFNALALVLALRQVFGKKENPEASGLLTLILGLHVAAQLLFPFQSGNWYNLQLSLYVMEMALVASYFYHVMSLPRFRRLADIVVLILVAGSMLILMPLLPGISSDFSALRVGDETMLAKGIMARGVFVMALFCVLMARIYLDVIGKRFNLLPKMSVLLAIMVYYVGVSGTYLFCSINKGFVLHTSLANAVGGFQIAFYCILILGFTWSWHT